MLAALPLFKIDETRGVVQVLSTPRNKVLKLALNQ
jgi:hypothetical protein